MTREEALKKIKAEIRMYDEESHESVEWEECYEALKQEKQELKQESVLDKIKDEIEAKCNITVGRENDGAITLHDVFEIIDKYKAEGEVENEI